MESRGDNAGQAAGDVKPPSVNPLLPTATRRAPPSPSRERGSETSATSFKIAGRERRAQVSSPSPAREREGPAPQAWEGEGLQPEAHQPSNRSVTA